MRSPDPRSGLAELPDIRLAESVPDPAPDWPEIAHLLTYAGRHRDVLRAERDAAFGPGNWCMRWRYRDASVSAVQTITLYEEAYLRFLAARPDVLTWLCSTARDVYDNAPSNVRSGYDYAVQEMPATHLQDISLRRVLVRLGRRFEGERLLEVRGPRSPGFALNPGQVPFHEPDQICSPPAWRKRRGWWRPESVEAFYQENKLLVVAPSALRLRPMLLGPDGLWCMLHDLPSFALLIEHGGGHRHVAMPTPAVRALWSVAVEQRAHIRIDDAPVIGYADLASVRLLDVPKDGSQILWSELSQHLSHSGNIR